MMTERMQRLLIGLLSLTMVMSCISSATAGEIGEFVESYDEVEEENEATEEDDDPDNDHTSVPEAAAEGGESVAKTLENTDERTAITALAFAVRLVAGDIRGEAFSLGRTPYDGRGQAVTYDDGDLRSAGLASAHSTPVPDTTLSPAGTDRHYQWTLRTNALTTSAFDAAGGALFAKVTSSKMPGIALSYQYARGLGPSGQRLGLGYATWEPNIALNETLTMHWGVGISNLIASGGIDETGLALGLGTVMYPVQPFVVSGRAFVHGFDHASVFDLRGSAGVYLTDSVAVTGNLRFLGIPSGRSLSTFGLGVRTDLGF